MVYCYVLEVYLLSKCTEWAQEQILLWLKAHDFYTKTGVKEGNVYFITLLENKISTINQLIVYFHGKPKVAVHPPWDGGIIYKKDSLNNPWVSVVFVDLDN